MIKWEYKHVAAGQNWDGLGEEGWKLVGLDANGRAHFKRPVGPPPTLNLEEFNRLLAGTQVNDPKST